MKKLLFIIAFIALSVQVEAVQGLETTQTTQATTDSVAVLEHHSMWRDVAKSQTHNPAFASNWYSKTISVLSVQHNYSTSNKAFEYQEGRRNNSYNISVQSYLRLPQQFIVWGQATYERGKRKGIVFNSSTNYNLLRPYVLGDTIGGNPTHESYAFSGGASKTMRRFAVGASIDFRAEQQFTRNDPRTRSIATNLELMLGAKYSLNRYMLGASAGAIFYKQTTDIAFYREGIATREYFYTGLGTFYGRFSNNNPSNYYKAMGFSLGLNVAPQNNSGAFAQINYNFAPYKQIVPNLNSLQLTTLYLKNIDATFGYRHEGKTQYSIYGEVSRSERLGNENIVGDASGNEYRSLFSLTMYKENTTRYSVSGLVKRGTKNTISALASVGYVANNQQYVMPRREQNVSFIFYNVKLQYQRKFKQGFALSCNIMPGAISNTKKNIDVPFANISAAHEEMLNNNYNNFSANYLVLNSGATIYYNARGWKTKNIYFSVNEQYMRGNKFNRVALNTTLGITF